MFKKLSIIIFILVVNISFVYAKTIITLACMPPEGTMDENSKLSYVSAVEGAFIKAGHRVADRQRLEKLMKEILLQQTSGMVDETDAAARAGKIMKVDYLVAVIVDNWDEQELDKRSMYLDNLKDMPQATDSYYKTVEKIRLTLKVIEVETSIIIAQGDIQGNKKDTPSKLATKIVDRVSKDVEKQLKKKK